MLSSDFVRRFPRLYHMADLNSWESIRNHGLLSTSGLLDLFEVTGEERETIETRHRPESVSISHPRHGTAVVRDQKPLSDSRLSSCLIDMTPTEWYQCLNSKVFFWLTEERLLRFLNAKSYKDKAHSVLTLDTSAIFRDQMGRISLSPMNSGCTRPFAHPRGSATFQRFSEYPFSTRRNRPDIAVELLIAV